jgi:quercetin dioxygenase-like cupin family protein
VKTEPTLSHGLIGAAVAVLAFAAQLSAQPITGTAIPGGCADPPKRPSEVGCYLSAVQPIEKLPDEPLFWHLYTYPTRASAEAAAKSEPTSTVAESLDKVWVFTIANAQWQPAAGDRIAVIGPLPVPRAKEYVARYMEATFPPNQAMRTSVHQHSGGPEAWYVLTGAQCLRTPEQTIVLRAGEGGFVPSGPPMVLTSIGAETRRALFLNLYDASHPWMTNTTEWTPTRECPPQ